MIFEVLNDMAKELTIAQRKRLLELSPQHFLENETQPKLASNQDYLEMFLHAKRIEGYSERTLKDCFPLFPIVWSSKKTDIQKAAESRHRKSIRKVFRVADNVLVS